ncbi:MAG: alpha/beta hydrolase [Flavobacteriia bacterium]|nr:alpha/beta hydrolase [Flavobacteriia bacterium]
MDTIHYLTVPKTARYYYSYKESNNKLFIALHGYANSITTFQSKFNDLTDHGFDVLIPEAMHRFYSKGTSGNVACSWMTKEMREFDIKENNHYLESLLENILLNKEYKHIYILGFSQGGSIAIRWVMNSKFHFDKILIWASSIPIEINEESLKNLPSKKTWIVGTKDEYIPEIERNKLEKKFLSVGFSVKKYSGNHQIDNEILEQVLQIKK